MGDAKVNLALLKKHGYAKPLSVGRAFVTLMLAEKMIGLLFSLNSTFMA
jgi:hypothetical protein